MYISGTRMPYDASEFYKLKFMLENAGIPFENTSEINSVGYRDGTVRLQLCYPNKAEKVSDVIYHEQSYGFSEGLLEIAGLVDEKRVGDTVEGHLTANQVFTRWSKHYHEVLEDDTTI